MSIKSIGMWSSAAVASLLLAACGGGGGGGGGTGTGSAGPTPTPTPAPTPTPTPTPTPAPTPTPSPTNTAPTVQTDNVAATAMPTDTITLTGHATDDGLPTGSSLSYQWVLANGPASPTGGPGAIIASPAAASTAVRLTGGAGAYVFNLTVSDGALSTTSVVNFTLGANTNLYPAAIAAGVNGWTISTPAAENLDSTKLAAAQAYSQGTGILTVNSVPRTEAGYIIRHGKLVYSWGDDTTRFEMKSTTKSMGGLALFLALDEGKLALTDKASARLPVFGTDPPVTVQAGSLSDVTVMQLATHTAGFSKGDILDMNGNPPRVLLYAPGTAWSYSDQGLNWLADTLTQTYSQDLNALLFGRVYGTLGIRTNDLVWRTNVARSSTLGGIPRRELAAGINATVNAMARVGLLMLRQGAWNNSQLLSNSVVASAHTPPASVAGLTNTDPTNYPGATTNYGILWWTNATGQIANVPTDAFWAWGLHETFIIVIPSQDLVIARAADTAGWHASGAEDWNADYGVLAPFLQPISQAVTGP